MRGVGGGVRVGALSLTGTRVTVMVVFWGGWLVEGGVERGVGEKEERGEMNYKERVYLAVIYKHSYTKQNQGMFYTCHQTNPA